MSFIREARHSCLLPYGRRGEVWRCDECGKVWVYKAPGNPDYERWQRSGWWRFRVWVERRLGGRS